MGVSLGFKSDQSRHRPLALFSHLRPRDSLNTWLKWPDRVRGSWVCLLALREDRYCPVEFSTVAGDQAAPDPPLTRPASVG